MTAWIRKTVPIQTKNISWVGSRIRMQVDRILHPEIDPLVERRNQSGNRGNYNIETIIGQIYRNRSRGRWNSHRSGDRSSNYQNNNRKGNMWPSYRQNVQWTFRNRGQSRNRNRNHKNDYMRGRSREIDMITGPISQEEKNLGQIQL